MGDMKTPDFDDLLAAFDIPDMQVDPKAAIESVHDENEGHLKQSIPVDEDAQVPSAPDGVVSVIVKNIRTLDSCEAAAATTETSTLDKENHHSSGNGLHNGFLSVTNLDGYSKELDGKSARCEGPPSTEAKLDLSGAETIDGPDAGMKDSAFNQFSPISSAEEFEDDDKIEVDDPPHVKEESQPVYQANVHPGPTAERESEKPRKAGVESTVKQEVSMPEAEEKGKILKSNRESESPSVNSGILEAFKVRNMDEKLSDEDAEKSFKNSAEKQLDNRVLDGKSGEKTGVNVTCPSNLRAKSSSKLSSCIAAIAALNAKKAAADINKEPQSVSRGPSPVLKESRESPRVTEKSPEGPQSPMEMVKKVAIKQPDSPRSVSSECSMKGSPSSPASSPPAIPKVRIKTIKTSSGEITRTVTRIMPEVEQELGRRGPEQANSLVVSSLLSSPPTESSVSSPPTTPVQSALVTASNSVMSPDVAQKQVTIKPVATAFLPVSAVKTAGSQVINLKFANNTTVKATVISAASVQSASSAILKAANAMQQQTVVVPASSLANAKLVPKTVHLANLNLLPQTAQASSELRQVLSKTQQPIKQALITAASTQPAKKVSRVHVVAYSQNAVVETFNKVLSSVNPVPVYTPNLNPPMNTNISIPLRGYKCLECGDSFALEKSLAQHYDRRSVRIEVTCNHCAKNLVFFNKCSLLSHARGHKDKGVVMQCSHLIMKPIPADQMIIPSSSNSVSSTTISAPVLTSAGGTAGAVAKTVASVPSAVISAPANAPILPAMPLDEDPSKLSRYGMKCLECSETFLDEILLATHFQHAAEAGGQTCHICQMLLPNKCSFSSHLRIHQHKSPYTCPECGAICRSSHFQTHVTRNCLHYTRKVGYRCIHCGVVYADLAALKSHIQGAHCEIFYKCPICPMAFKSAPSTHSHAYTQHPGIKIGEAKIIYKCSMCDTVFTQQTLLCSHFDQHVAKQKVAVFKCPDCALLYAQKQLMVEHIKTVHGILKSIEGPPNLGPQQPLVTKPLITSAGPNKTDGNAVNGTDRLGKKPSVVVRKTGSRSKANNPGWMCQDCEEWFPEREDYISHMKKDHGKQMKKHPCRQCEKSFSSSHSLCRHNRIKHKGIRKVYTCWNCPDSKRTFTKRFMLEKHIRLMHGIKNPDMTQMPEPTTIMESLKKEENKPCFQQMPLPPKRKLEDAVVELRPPPRGAITQPLKKLKINVIKLNKCAVCGFTTENVTQFQEHLPQHKTDGSTFQCRECGLCYTSLQSLTRHLFIVHKMKNAQQVARQNGARDENAADSKMSLEDSQAELMLMDKKCKVCFKTFETEAALNTHMRTHGMAFIKSKRLCTSEK
ncbi:zinc finger protein 532 isoform X5 [Chiloscyllium plagiosum]|nr:zinc finger protein 532 isoform X5 [Chiloscyllium plagiosum]XP_043535678.1 zinc finger protein 532 isoform X5 [Chiloscyllium plagiosum]XP_043535763.1 zinc finger protein 532 isoform X5 [Chiloscyllium plagiosum]XP_043535853.1 zinc finger protein 532 isoform X5 [Chiloscyllium plagiosum]XP_043535944.1 zinc finger protein 532 isoform X5 [Chiloscyllium plagiosum]